MSSPAKSQTLVDEAATLVIRLRDSGGKAALDAADFLSDRLLKLVEDAEYLDRAICQVRSQMDDAALARINQLDRGILDRALVHLRRTLGTVELRKQEAEEA